MYIDCILTTICLPSILQIQQLQRALQRLMRSEAQTHPVHLLVQHGHDALLAGALAAADQYEERQLVSCAFPTDLCVLVDWFFFILCGLLGCWF